MRLLMICALALSVAACEGPNNPVPAPTPLPQPAPAVPPPQLPSPAEPSLSVVLTGFPSTVTAGTEARWYAGAREAHGPVTFTWTLGDGSPAVPTNAGELRATYRRGGEYTLTIQARDAEARTATTSTPVLVAPAPPPPPPPPTPPPAAPAALAATVTCSPGSTGATPVATTCNVTTLSYGGTAIPASAVLSMVVDWGDGSAPTTTGAPTAAVASYTYPLRGTFTVLATVNATTVDGPKTVTTSQSLKVN